LWSHGKYDFSCKNQRNRLKSKYRLNKANFFNFAGERKREMKPAFQEKELVDVLEVVETTDLMDLVVFNDDVNTFDHVINTLIKFASIQMNKPNSAHSSFTIREVYREKRNV
jgi:hypothetical protein